MGTCTEAAKLRPWAVASNGPARPFQWIWTASVGAHAPFVIFTVSMLSGAAAVYDPGADGDPRAAAGAAGCNVMTGVDVHAQAVAPRLMTPTTAPAPTPIARRSITCSRSADSRVAGR